MNRVLLAVGAAGAVVLASVAAATSLEGLASVTLAGAAVGVAALTVAAVAWPEPGVWAPRRRPPTVGLIPWAEWVREGELGREEIVRLLDRIDRMGSHPELPMRTEAELRSFRTMPRAAFLNLVDRRLDEIEGPA